MERCEKHGHFDRRNGACLSCSFSIECKGMNVDCYGEFRKNKEICHKCNLAEYCREAANPGTCRDVSFEKIEYSEEASSKPNIPEYQEPPVADQADEERMYTREELAGLVRQIIAVDDLRVRDMVCIKLSDPDITLSELGRRYGISKQAVGKLIVEACQVWPSLNLVLRNRKEFNKWRNIPLEKSMLQKNKMEQLELPF